MMADESITDEGNSTDYIYLSHLLFISIILLSGAEHADHTLCRLLSLVDTGTEILGTTTCQRDTCLEYSWSHHNFIFHVTLT